jgi:hypothetical protein
MTVIPRGIEQDNKVEIISLNFQFNVVKILNMRGSQVVGEEGEVGGGYFDIKGRAKNNNKRLREQEKRLQEKKKLREQY